MSNCGLPEGCEDQCCLNRSGMCTLDTADYSDIDRAVGMRGCGFIGVNDRYLVWKYGVPYKDFNCGHCQYYQGETHGKCTNEQVEVDLKERYSGAHACKEFKKQEGVREVPKQTYYTKCGRQFEKNSTAVVTGYDIDINDPECADCPFQVEVKEGWPQVHKKWECRAGSQPPNHKTEWTGSLEDKNTINIHSLDNQLMEVIKEFCENHPDLGAGYNADHMADCRRTLAVNCSSNKKGMAAKKQLIEKFFPEDEEEIPLTSDEGLYYCEKEDCPFNDREDGCCFAQEDHDECFAKDLISAIKDCDCENENVQFAYKLIRPETHIEEDGEDLTCETEKSQTNAGSGSCVSGTAETGAISNVDKPTVMIAKGSNVEKEAGEVKSESQECSYRGFKRDCGMFYPKTGTCSLLIKTGSDLEHEMENFKAHADCEIYKSTLKRLESEKNKVEQIAALEIAEQSSSMQPFDYSTVDDDTAAYLQDKANKITEIRIKSVIAMGKELKEAQDKLANNKTGSFGAWSQSIGLSRQTVQNYIQAYDYIVKNFDNIESADNIQPSLLFAASKPSAPKELSDKVASGDITTHKQYKALEQKLKDAQDEIEFKEMQIRTTENRLTDENERLGIQLKQTEDLAKKQAELASQKSRDARQMELTVEELKKYIDKLNQEGGSETKVAQLQQQIDVLTRQLHDKPIEVAATEVVEKEIIPDEVTEAIYCKIKYLYEGIKNLTAKEIQIFAAHVDPAYYDTLTSDIDEAAVILEKISSAAYGATNMIEPEGHCGDCIHADMDAVTEDELDEGKTRCTLTGKIVDIMDGCGKYKSYREGQS